LYNLLYIKVCIGAQVIALHPPSDIQRIEPCR